MRTFFRGDPKHFFHRLPVLLSSVAMDFTSLDALWTFILHVLTQRVTPSSHAAEIEDVRQGAMKVRRCQRQSRVACNRCSGYLLPDGRATSLTDLIPRRATYRGAAGGFSVRVGAPTLDTRAPIV